MPFDGITLHAVVCELQEALTGGRINKIYQPHKDELIFYIRRGREELKLLMSSHPVNCRIHLTESIAENPLSPPAFCMLLRKHLIGGNIVKIEQPDLERIVEITIHNNNEFMQPVEWKLIIEIMGRHSNIILVQPESNTIIDSIKRIPVEVNRYRQILPGEKYIYPPMQYKITLTTFDHNNFMSTLCHAVVNGDTRTVSKWILDNIMGLSGTASREITFRAGVDPQKTVGLLMEEEKNNLVKALEDVGTKIASGNFSPSLYINNNTSEPDDFWVLPLLSMEQKHHVKVVKSHVNEIVDLYFSKKEKTEAFTSLKKRACSEISKHLEKLRQGFSFYKKKFQETGDLEKYRLWGEILSAYLYQVKPGLNEVKLPNFYDNDKIITIPLNEKLTPSQNVQLYFNRYKKLQSTRIMLEKKLKEISQEIYYLESVLFDVENCGNMEDLHEIYHELENQGYLKAAGKKCPRQSKSEPLKFRSSDGFTIYVGKNNRQNDMLTLKKAGPEDIWLHTKDIPGSHVIIECSKQKVSDKALYEASILAAYFSRARNGSNVPVDYTLKKHVRKPAGAKPGFVIYDHHKTLYVTPDEATVKRLSL